MPKSEADEKKLAEKGTELLEQYHAAKGEVKTPSGKWKAAPAKRAATAKSGAGMRSGAALEGAGGKDVKGSSKKI